MTALTVARAATAHIGKPGHVARARAAFAAWRSIGAGFFDAAAAAIRAI